MIAIKKILVPTDFSDLSVPAIGYAISLAKDHRADVTVLHVIAGKALKQHFSQDYITEGLISPGEAPAAGHHPNLEDFFERKKQFLQRFVVQKIGPDLLHAAKIAPLVKLGKVVDEIVATAKEGQCDLIVMASHGPGLRRFLHGSFTDRVRRQAPCPVLSIQPAAEVRTDGDKRVPVRLIESWAA